jgi:hypothetical protein
LILSECKEGMLFCRRGSLFTAERPRLIEAGKIFAGMTA